MGAGGERGVQCSWEENPVGQLSGCVAKEGVLSVREWWWSGVKKKGETGQGLMPG